MKGNLTIDNGNTSVKVAFFIGPQIVATNRFVRRDVRLLQRFSSTYKPDTAIVCSTASSPASQRIEQLVDERCRRVIHLTHETPMPIRLGYRTPQTLGRDRIATAVGAWTIAQRLDNACDVLVIDAGTAITYDLITSDGCFVGGNNQVFEHFYVAVIYADWIQFYIHHIEFAVEGNCYHAAAA